MTVDVPFVDVDDTPQGNNLNYSIVSSDEEDPLSLTIKLKVSEKNKVPVVVLKKKDNSDDFIVSRRTPKPKKFSDYKTSERKVQDNSMAVSPRKRRQSKIPHEHESPSKRALDQICQAMSDDLKLKSPLKVHIEDMNSKTPSTTLRAMEHQTTRSARLPRAAKTNLNLNENDWGLNNLCQSYNINVNVSTPKKRNASKSTVEDNIKSSPRKRQIIDDSINTPRLRSGPKKTDVYYDNESSDNESRNGVSGTPRRRVRPSRLAGTPQNQENEPTLSERRRTRTSVRCLTEVHSPVRSVKKNLDESFRTQILKHHVLKESTVSNRRKMRHRSISTSSDMSEKSVDFNVNSKKIRETPTRVLRSRSVSLSSNQSSEEILIEIDNAPKRTPNRRKTACYNRTEEDSDVEHVQKTPRRRKTLAGASRSAAPSTPKTPRNRLKLIRDGIITPSMQSRKSTVPANTTPLMQARSQLHVSFVPTSLPCREKEYLNVYNFLKGKLLDGCGGCMYVSGVPGTGKTATVTSVIDRLQSAKDVPKFSYVNVNGMRLTEPKQSYVEIWKQLTGKTRPWEQAQSLLEERFTKKGNLSPVIMLIDELDILCTKRQDVVYNLLDWPSKSRDQLIVITIANTMDLPERLLMNKVTSRLGLTRLTFQPYNHKQLMEIVSKRLTGTDSFNPDAVQLVARKVASVSGDARRALDICRRAAEIAEEEGTTQLVSIAHVDQALNAMITQPKVMAMKRCSRLEKLVLQAIVAEVERTGVEETTFADVFKMLVSCCALDGFKMVSSTVAQRAVCQLSSCRLILTDQKCSNIFQKIILNVSVDEVYFALKK